MENGQRNTKKIVAIIAIVLAVVLIVAGVSIWSYRVYHANQNPAEAASTTGEGVSGGEAHTTAPGGAGSTTQADGKTPSEAQGSGGSLTDPAMEEILGQLTNPDATLPAVTPEETATDAAAWGSEDEQPSGGSPVKDLSTAQQIVSYFNTAANKVKTGKPALRVDSTMRVRENLTGMSEAENASDSYPKGSNLNDAFPVAGQSWASRLEASGVKSAACSLKDGKYYITIAMKDEENPKPLVSQHGKAFTCFDTDELMQALEETGDAEELELLEGMRFSTTYSGCKISCVVDAKTGNMLSAKYYTDITMGMTLVGYFLKVNVTTTQSFTMDW